MQCTVTTRNVEKNFVSLLRDQEGTVIDKANVNEVISIGDVPFEPKMFDKNMDWLEIINNLINILAVELPLHPKASKKEKEKKEESKSSIKRNRK